MTSLYGPIVSGLDVRAAAEATARLWIPVYTAEMGRATGLTLPPVRSYGAALPPGTDPEELPAIVITAPGLTGTPERRGDGRHDVTWAMGVGVVVADPVIATANDLCDAYTAVVRALFVQQGGLGGFAETTTWIDEEVSPAGWDTEVAVYRGAVMFEVRVRDVLNRFGGPVTPPVVPTDPVDAVAVATVDVDVHRQ